jgi:hypothetical protein
MIYVLVALSIFDQLCLRGDRNGTTNRDSN